MNSGSSSRLYGLIGYPVKHSLSGHMHNAAFRASHINAEYRLFEIKPEEIPDFLFKPDKIVKDILDEPVRVGDVRGFNVTIPYKVKVKEALEEYFPLKNSPSLTQSVAYYLTVAGAVNTVKRNGNILEYWNTDAEGFLKSLQADLYFSPKNKNVMLIGCGGAGRSVIAALSWKKTEVAKIYVCDISQDAVESLKKHLAGLPDEYRQILTDKIEFVTQEAIPDIIKECHLLVNASPQGMNKDEPPVIDKKLLHKNLSVYDAVYNRETQLLKDAKQLGLQAVGGLGMLLYQGAASWQLWIGREPPLEAMRQALAQNMES